MHGMIYEIPSFTAKCQKCGYIFLRPSLGDHVYGKKILSTLDGKIYAIVDAFDDFPQRLATLLGHTFQENFWDIVAFLADPIAGQPLVAKIICPNCLSNALSFWEGDRSSPARVCEVTFFVSSKFDDQLLKSVVVRHCS